MSVEEIRSIWEYNRNQRLSTNINCGILRQCGKSLFLRSLILEEVSKPENCNKSFILIVRSHNNRREYEDLLKLNSHIFIITLERRLDVTLRSLNSLNSVIFSDEIENIEDYILPMGFTLFAGVYSYPPTINSYENSLTQQQIHRQRQVTLERQQEPKTIQDSERQLEEKEAEKNRKIKFILNS